METKGFCSGCWDSDCQCQSYQHDEVANELARSLQAAYPRSDAEVGADISEAMRQHFRCDKTTGYRPIPMVMPQGHEATLRADAERLAELKTELAREVANPTTGSLLWMSNFRRLESLIAVYEECAVRGLTFGGRR